MAIRETNVRKLATEEFSDLSYFESYLLQVGNSNLLILLASVKIFRAKKIKATPKGTLLS